jgi:hypothetical protein
MDDFRGYIDGRSFLTGSTFRSGYFLSASIVGLCAVVIDVYILIHHWQALNKGAVVVLGGLIGVQLIYQWWRTLRYYSKVRELYSMRSEDARDGTPLDVALRIAVGGLVDILFYCYGMTLMALIFIGVLLTHLGRPS